MKRILSLVLVAVMALTIVGCESKQETGAVTGAALGGLIGSRFGGGTGQLVAVGVGAVAGALIGGKIGKMMDENDRLKAQQTLESTPTGHTSSWQNPDNGNRYSVTPTKTYHNKSDQPCREYVTKAWIGGKEQEVYGRACRQADGSWKTVK